MPALSLCAWVSGASAATFQRLGSEVLREARETIEPAFCGCAQRASRSIRSHPQPRRTRVTRKGKTRLVGRFGSVGAVIVEVELAPSMRTRQDPIHPSYLRGQQETGRLLRSQAR